MKKFQESVTACLFLLFVFGMFALLLVRGENLWNALQTDMSQEDSFLERIEAGVDTLENQAGQKNPLRNSFIDLNGAFQRFIGQRVVEDPNSALTVHRLDDGRMTFTVSPLPTLWKAQNMGLLSQWCAQRDIPLLYVQAPFKIDPTDPQLPAGTVDYTNENADHLLLDLQEQGVDTLDLRKEIKEQGLDHSKLFYKTDSHWTTDAAFWASGTLLETLKERYGIAYDERAAEKENFTCRVYEGVFLGSQGKRVGRLYGGTDDVAVLLPSYETKMRYEVPIHSLVKEGSFEQALLEYGHLDPVDHYEKSPYYVYSGGDYPLSYIQNEANEKGAKILLVRDSYACATAPFLALGLGQVDTYDLRYNQRPLAEYIEETKPDAVVFLFNPGVIANEEMFRFGLEGEQ